MKFEGFPRGTLYTPVPNPLFGPLLEVIDDPAELKCALRVMWLLHQKKDYPRFVTLGELVSDRVLLLGLKGLDAPPGEAITRGIGKAVERGIFLRLKADYTPRWEANLATSPAANPIKEGMQEGEYLYFLNDPQGQRAVAGISQGRISIGGIIPREGVVGEPPVPKANIFTLYEENIGGTFGSILAEKMKEAEEQYPQRWIEEAFEEAVSNNVRKWSYIEAILDRRAREGKKDGEPGRHTQKTSSTDGFLDYLQKWGRLPPK
jgi:DnaD/phage-associated family protein